MKKKLIRSSEKEDAKITKAAKSEPDSRLLTDKQWAKVKPTLSRGLGRPSVWWGEEISYLVD
jgi:hypothetical protein